jgi:hypothetical protein
MTKASRVVVLPAPFPPLSRQRCQRCDREGVVVIAMWTQDEVPREELFCSTDCARYAGWPWLTPEQPKSKSG